MKYLAYISLFIGLSFSVLSVRALDIVDFFSLANEAYEKEHYQEAIVLYDSLANRGKTSFQLEYNLGNAHFKAGNLGKSILHFERAKNRRPHNNDLAYNLRIANRQVIENIQARPGGFWKSLSRSIGGLLPVHIWAILSLLSLWIGLGGVYVYLFKKDTISPTQSLRLGVGCLALSLFLLLISSSRSGMESYDDYGIILPKRAYVKSAPGARSNDVFVVYEGLKIKVNDQVDGWLKVEMADKKEGWLPLTDVGII